VKRRKGGGKDGCEGGGETKERWGERTVVKRGG